jgi:hypothetical protein
MITKSVAALQSRFFYGEPGYKKDIFVRDEMAVSLRDPVLPGL